MCFSATASLAASLFLLVIGILTLKNLPNKKLFALALMPLLFSIQQFFEFLLWTFPEYKILFGYCFLFFAFVLWPFWVPFSMYMLDRSKLNLGFIAFGLAVSIATKMQLLSQNLIINVGNNICYSFDHLLINGTLFTFFYLCATILPFLFNKKLSLKVLGLVLLASAMISLYSWYYCFVSVWCFFAAILSILIYFTIKNF